MEKQKKINVKIAPKDFEEIAYNTRYKLYPQPDGGDPLLAQRIVANRPIFKPDNGWEQTKQRKKVSAEQREKEKEALRDALAEYASNRDELLLSQETDRAKENKLRSMRRAKGKVRDYVMAEYDFGFFVTLTLSGKDFPRDDVYTALHKLTKWLDNMVQRNGLKYVLVPEYHKDGKSIHWHGFFNNALRLVYSGTLVPPGGGKPLKAETLIRKNIPLESCTQVYNLPDWKYGFSTAIPMYGTRIAAANYICKYIVKAFDETNGDKSKIGGRYYVHSNNLRLPQYVLAWTDDYQKADGFLVKNPGNELKIKDYLQTSVNTNNAAAGEAPAAVPQKKANDTTGEHQPGKRAATQGSEDAQGESKN